MALFLIVLGVGFMAYSEGKLLESTGESLIVAGVLALFVDPFLKQKMLKEASQGIFVHLLGFEHHPQVKDKLKEIVFETKLLRTRLDVNCTIEPRAEGFYWFHVEFVSEIVNPTNNAVDYKPGIECEAAHKLEVPRMSLTSEDGRVEWTTSAIDTIELKGSPGVVEIKTKTFKLQPNVRYRVHGQYKMKLLHGYNIFYAGRPTLRMSIRANAPPDYEIQATPTTVRTDGYWEYPNIQMVGDHVTLRWRKKGGDWL